MRERASVVARGNERDGASVREERKRGSKRERERERWREGVKEGNS